MNKQNTIPNSTANLAKNTLQELWSIKDETADKFSSVSAYFEYLKTSQKLQTKSAKRASSSATKAKAIVKPRRTAAMH
jgi:hypothetical protein